MISTVIVSLGMSSYQVNLPLLGEEYKTEHQYKENVFIVNSEKNPKLVKTINPIQTDNDTKVVVYSVVVIKTSPIITRIPLCHNHGGSRDPSWVQSPVKVVVTKSVKDKTRTSRRHLENTLET
jgi:hypothetical protein